MKTESEPDPVLRLVDTVLRDLAVRSAMCPRHDHALAVVANRGELRWVCPGGEWQCPVGRAHGTFRLRLLIYRAGQQIDRCDTGSIHWSATRPG